MSASTIAAEVKAALSEAGAATGDGPFVVTLERQGTPDESQGYRNLSLGAPTEHPFTAVKTKFDHREMASGNIQNGDVKLNFEVSDTEPRTSDKFTMDGRTYSIVGVEALAPGGKPLMWKIHARGGNIRA